MRSETIAGNTAYSLSLNALLPGSAANCPTTPPSESDRAFFTSAILCDWVRVSPPSFDMMTCSSELGPMEDSCSFPSLNIMTNVPSDNIAPVHGTMKFPLGATTCLGPRKVLPPSRERHICKLDGTNDPEISLPTTTPTT